MAITKNRQNRPFLTKETLVSRGMVPRGVLARQQAGGTRSHTRSRLISGIHTLANEYARARLAYFTHTLPLTANKDACGLALPRSLLTGLGMGCLVACVATS